MNLDRSVLLPVIVRSFYALGTIVLSTYITMFHQNIQHLYIADWLWPLMWLGPNVSEKLYLAIFLFAVLCNVLAALHPNWIARSAAAVGWLFWAAAIFSFGRITNSAFGWLLCSLILVFVNLNKPIQTFIVLRCCQGACLSFYFSAGLWKLKSLWPLLGRDNLWSEILPAIIPNFIAYGMAEGNNPSSVALHFFSTHPTISIFNYITVLSLQLSTCVWLFFPRFSPIFALILAGFHMGSALTIGPGFQDHVILIIYLFFIFPLLVDSNNRITQEKLP